MMALEALFNETRLLFHALKQWADAVHPESEVTVSMRAVLERLLIDGPATVPSMARARNVSRQHVQQQVDALIDRGWVEKQVNPAHRRSARIALSDRGRALIQTMRGEELDALSRLQSGVSDSAISEATQVLAAWRAALSTDVQRRTS